MNDNGATAEFSTNNNNSATFKLKTKMLKLGYY